MANAIQIKRRSSSGAAGAPNASVLKWGELAFNEADNTLYYGYGSGDNQAVSVPSIGGSGSYSLRGGTNASGVWPISVTGNSSTVTSGVYCGSTTVNGNVATWLSASNTLGAGYVVSTDLSTNNSSSYLARADAIKTYVDNNLNNATVVRTTGNQTIGGVKTFSSTIGGSIDGNAGTVTNGVYSSSVTVEGNIPVWLATQKTLGAGYLVSTDLSTNNNSTYIPRADAVKTYIDNLLGANDAMIFKGTIGTGGTVTSLPTTYSAGWTFRVITAGTYAGNVCEVGDLIIAVIDRSASGNQNSDWTVAQTNIDGAVLNTRTLTAGNGLSGGGDLSGDRTFNVGAGDGISVSTDAVAVDSTVVRTTGNQSINGIKSFENLAYFHNGVAVSGGSLDIYQPDVGVSFRVTETGTVSSGIWGASTIAVNKGGTGQTSYTDGQLLIGNSTGNTLTKAILSAGTSIGITNGAGSITINHADTSNLSGAQGTDGIASITVDGLGHVTAVTTASYITSASLCSSIANCPIDGGTF